MKLPEMKGMMTILENQKEMQRKTFYFSMLIQFIYKNWKYILLESGESSWKKENFGKIKIFPRKVFNWHIEWACHNMAFGAAENVSWKL